MKNLDGGFYTKNFGWIYILFIGNNEWKAKLLNVCMSTRGFLIEILLHKL